MVVALKHGIVMSTYKYRFNLETIRDSFLEVKKHFKKINNQLTLKRDDFTSEVMDNMLCAYSFVNDMLDKQITPFGQDKNEKLLELNHIVLCGKEWKSNEDYLDHIRSTSERFSFFLDPIKKWHKKNENDHILKRSAVTYVSIVSNPQLFFEGNHRTGSIIASWLLISRELPPFVLNRNNAVAYFEPSYQIKFTSKNRYSGKIKLQKYHKVFNDFLEEHSSKEYYYKV